MTQSDAIVAFTQKQADDLKKRFGDGNIVVIPHAHAKVESLPLFEERNRFQVVYAARYAEEKQHELALAAFKKVVEAVPNAELQLYGFGKMKDSILAKIKELELDKNVYVNDFVVDVESV